MWWNEVEKFSSLSSSVQMKTSPQLAGTAPTDDPTACTQHARRRSSSSGHPRALVTSLLYADGHVAHDTRVTVGLLSTPEHGAGASRRWRCSTPSVTTISGFLSSSVKLHDRRTISQENCLRLALWLRCGFCQITLTSCITTRAGQMP